MRLRFTIRDLLWLTALVALAVGWWLDHRRLTADPFPNNLSLIIGGGQEVQEEEILLNGQPTVREGHTSEIGKAVPIEADDAPRH